MNDELVALVYLNVLINLRRSCRVESLDGVGLKALVPALLQPFLENWVAFEEDR